jgi:hypothetical protein
MALVLPDRLSTPLPLRPSTAYRRLMERLPIRLSNIRGIAGPVQRLRFNAAQEQLWQVVAPKLDLGELIRLIILKARREGVSTFTEALLTAICTFLPYVQAMVVAHEAAATKRIWAMSRRFVTDSPLTASVKPVGHALHFRGQSVLELATAGSPNAARSADLTALHASELAFWKDASALLAIRQCLPLEEGVFSIEVDESTANGMADDGGLFYDEWNQAAEGRSDLEPVFLPWHTFPQYTLQDQTDLRDLDAAEATLQRDLRLTNGQLRWRRQIIQSRCQGDVEKFNQEYPATPEMAFIMSGHPFFSPEDLVWLEPHIRPGLRGRLEVRHGKITLIEDPRGWLRLFRAPQLEHEYIIGADSAMGIAAGDHDRSAAEVLDMVTMEQVAEYEAISSPHVFAGHLALLGKVYNTALLVPEVQASGGGGGRELLAFLQQDWHYHHIHRWVRVDRIRKGQAVLYGWETNSQTRPRMIARLREAMQERTCLLHSRALVKQLRAFGENDAGKMEALAGHDDLLFALMMALVSRSENYVAAHLYGEAKREVTLSLDRLGYSEAEDPDDTSRYAFTGTVGPGPQDRPEDLLAW